MKIEVSKVSSDTRGLIGVEIMVDGETFHKLIRTDLGDYIKVGGIVAGFAKGTLRRDVLRREPCYSLTID